MPATAIGNNVLNIFTDGSCRGNPGPMGIGIVVIHAFNNVQEISKFIGMGTNNIAELTAIKTALEMNANDQRPIHLYTDSEYSINVLTRFKSKKNVNLINEIKRLLIQYKPGVVLHHVRGHESNVYNNLADKLATQASVNRESI